MITWNVFLPGKEGVAKALIFSEGSNPSLTATALSICDFRLCALAPNRARSALPRVNRREGVIKNVIGHAATERDPLGLVKDPVDSKINSALAVLFLGL